MPKRNSTIHVYEDAQMNALLLYTYCWYQEISSSIVIRRLSAMLVQTQTGTGC